MRKIFPKAVASVGSRIREMLKLAPSMERRQLRHERKLIDYLSKLPEIVYQQEIEPYIWLTEEITRNCREWPSNGNEDKNEDLRHELCYRARITQVLLLIIDELLLNDDDMMLCLRDLEVLLADHGETLREMGTLFQRKSAAWNDSFDLKRSLECIIAGIYEQQNVPAPERLEVCV